MAEETTKHDPIPKLDRRNYYSWSKRAISEMVERNCWNAVDPGFDDVELANLAEWQSRANRKALSFMLKYVSDAYFEDIGECVRAKEAWTKLKNIHSSFTLIQCLEKMKEMFCVTKTEDVPMHEYMAKLQGLNRTIKSGNYGLELSDRQLAGVFLVGLPKDKYKVLITMMEREYQGNLLTTERVKARLLQEEDFEEYEFVSGALSSSSSRGRGGATNYNRGRGRGRGGSKNNQQNDSATGSTGYVKEQDRKCYRCNVVGHMAKDCKVKKEDKKEDKNENSDNSDKRKFKALVSNSNALFSNGSASTQSEWLVDCAANDHICNDKSMFVSLRGSTGKVVMGKGCVEVNGVGTVELDIVDECGGWTVSLSNVLYVPDYSFNLLSCSKLAEKGIVCETHKLECIAKDKENNDEILFKAPVKDGLYVVYVKRRVSAASVNMESGSSVKNAVALRSVVEWHSKLGHLHVDAIKKISVIGCTGKLDEKCDICEKGKATKVGFPQTSDRKSNNVLDLIHTDVMGKLTNSVGGSKYIITFIDDYSRFVTVYYLKKKSEAFSAFKQYQTYVEVLHERKIKALQSDGGGEYIDGEFQAYLRERGIVHRKTVRSSPEQNGISERQNRTLANIVRCLLIQSGLPKSFWAEALSVAVHVRNLSPSRAIGNCIPLELWSSVPVTVDMYERLVVFGCKSWLYEKGDKFDQRAIDCVFVGYGDVDNVKGYKVWCPTKGKFVVAHNVKFDQKVFPYIEKSKVNTEWVVPVP